MNPFVELLDGFWTWQTPLSFMAGVGVHHLFVKYIRDRKAPDLMNTRERVESIPKRIWAVFLVAAIIVGYIGWRTQETANEVESQAHDTVAFAQQTNECLKQVVDVLTTRVGYNDAINALDRRRQELDLRRQAVWEQLVDDLAKADNSSGLSQDALQRFMTNNASVKADQAKIVTDQSKLAAERNANQYPDCALVYPPEKHS